MLISVMEDRCAGCGLCVRECVHHKAAKGTNHVDHTYALCNSCLHCFAICPQNAIRVEPAVVSRTAEPEPVDRVEFDDLLQMLTERRSRRRFTDRTPDGAVLRDLLRASTQIPSGGNRRDISITVLTNETTKQKVKEAVIGFYRKQCALLSNPLVRSVLSIFGDRKLKAASSDAGFLYKLQDALRKLEAGEDLVFYDAPVVLLFHTSSALPTPQEDCVLAAYNIVLAAETLGLGTCFVSMAQTALARSKDCRELVGLPDDHHVHAVVVLGYPTDDYARGIERERPEISWVT